MLREKPANEVAVEKLINFLAEAEVTLKTENIKYDFSEIIKSNGVAKRSFSDLKALKIVKHEAGKKPEWIGREQPLRITALQILDYRLKKSKKAIHVPIPDFAPITDSLKTIAERLAHITLQHERLLRTPKNAINETDVDLFRVDEQRLYIAGQIASAVYKSHSFCLHEMIAVPEFDNGNATSSAMKAKCKLCGYEPDNAFQVIDINSMIVSATDDLMSKLLNKPDNDTKATY